jgi:hypothetical protein
VLRERTERPEALRPSAVLCPVNDEPGIEAAFDALIHRARDPRPVFGNGTAADRIVEHLLSTSVGALRKASGA